MFDQLHCAIHMEAIYQMAGGYGDRCAFVIRLRRVFANAEGR